MNTRIYRSVILPVIFYGWCEIHKLINSTWNKEELPEQWKESIIIPVYKKGHKRDCSNYCGVSLLSTTYRIL
jgi:hypothetical protein